MATSKILIADDSELMRASLRALLSSEERWSICGEAVDGGQAVLLAGELKPDLVILDLAMPIMTGLEAAAEIMKRQPELPVILYTMHKSKEIDLEAKKAGARLVISKSDRTEVLVAGVQESLAQRPALQLAAVAEGQQLDPAPAVGLEQATDAQIKPADPQG